MGSPAQKFTHYSYADYLTWDDENRYEIINGIVHDMGAPSPEQQIVSTNLVLILGNFLKENKCKILHAPLDVQLVHSLESNMEIYNVVQPDLIVLCDKSKLDNRGLKGVPDLAVEILSPSSYKRDTVTKLLLYQKYGVKEYWIVDPEIKTLRQFILEPDGKYNADELIFKEEESFHSFLFPELKIEIKDVFVSV